MISILIAALLSFMIALPNQTSPTIEQKVLPQEVKQMSTPIPQSTPQSKDNSNQIKALTEKIRTMKQANAIAERLIENGASNKQATEKLKQSIISRGNEIAELERQLVELTNN